MPHKTGDEEPTVTRLPSIGRTLSPQPPSNPASPSKHVTSTTLVPISPSQKDLRSPKQQNIMHSDGTTALRVRTISSQEALAAMRQAHTQKMIARSRANYAKQRQKFKLVQSIYLPHDDPASPVQLKFGPFIPPKLPAYERIPYKVYKNGLISPIQSPTHGDSHEKDTEHDQALDQSLPTSSFLVNQRRPYIPPRTLDPRHARSVEQHARHHHHAEEYHRQHGRTGGTSYQFKFLIPSRDMTLSSGQRRGMAPITSGPDYFPVSPYLTDDSKRKHDHVLGYHDRKPRSPPQHHQHHHDYIQDQQQQFVDNINNNQQHDELMPDGRSERAVVNEVQPQEWGDDDADAGDEEEEDAAKTETDTTVPTTTTTATTTSTTATVPSSVSVPSSPAPARTALVSPSKRPYKQQVNISTQTDGDITTGSLITPRDSGEHTTSDADAQTEPIPVNEHADTRGTGTDGGEPTEGDTIVVPTQDAPPPPPQPEATDTQYTPDFEAVTASKLVEQTAAESQQQQELLNPRDQHGRTMRRKVANKKNQDVQKVAVSVSCRGLVLSHLGRNSHPLAAVYALDEEGFFHYVAETEVLLDTPDPNFRTHLIVDGCSPNQQFMFCIYDVEEDMTNATITDNHMIGYIIVRASDLQIAVDEKSLQLNLLYDPAYNSHLEDAPEGEPGTETSQQRIQQPGPIDGAYIILHNVTSAAQKRQKAYGEITPIDIAVVCKGLPKETNALTALYVKTDNTGLFEAAAHTERVKRSENPLFKELLPIDHFANYDRELMCVVYDIDGESKDETKSKDTIRPIGSCTFTLNYLLKKTKQEAAFQLMNEHKEYIPSTYIYLKAFLPTLSTHVDTRATVIDGYQDMGKTYELNVALSQLPHNQHGIHIALYAKEKGKMAKKHEYIGETEKIRDTLNPTFNATLLIENVKPDDTLQYIFNVYDTQYQTHKVEDYATNKGLISNPMPAIDQPAVSVPLTEQQIAERARETRDDATDVGVVGIAPPAEEMVPTNIWMGRVTLTMKQLLQYTEDPDDPSQRVEAEFVLLDMSNKPVGNSTIVIGLREREAM